MVLIASHPVMANIAAPNSDDYCATMTEKKFKGTSKAQQQAREDFKSELIGKYINKLIKQGVYGKEAAKRATELATNDMKTLNALHNPDLIAGGYDKVVDLGDASVNKSIGSQWNTKGDSNLSRVSIMDKEAQKALE